MKRSAVIILMFILIISLTGCAHEAKRPLVQIAPPSCADVLVSAGETVRDSEIAVLLDGALVREDMDGCWKPLMEKSIAENRNIPQRHLEKGVNVFNEKQYLEVYHRIVTRYFMNLSKMPGAYQSKDRLLLENYASYVIRGAKSAREKKLMDVQVVCKRVDPDLYTKLFK